MKNEAMQEQTRIKLEAQNLADKNLILSQKHVAMDQKRLETEKAAREQEKKARELAAQTVPPLSPVGQPVKQVTTVEPAAISAPPLQPTPPPKPKKNYECGRAQHSHSHARGYCSCHYYSGNCS